MKQNEEGPDYRSMNEVQLKFELIQIEKKVLDITGDPIDYTHYCPFLDWGRDEAKVDAVEEMMLDRCYILNLLFDIHCTLAEVDSLAKVPDENGCASPPPSSGCCHRCNLPLRPRGFLPFEPWFRLRIKAFALPNHGILPSVAMSIIESPAKNAIFERIN